MAVKIFFCYAHEDEDLLNKLKRHLWPLQRQGLIDVWHDRDISAGSEWEHEISQHLNAAQLILLLVSPDFMYSEYCYEIEMQRALERLARGEAHVIPIILRPCEWDKAPFAHVQVLPRDGKPVTQWDNQDAAFHNVVQGIRRAIEQQRSLARSPIPLSSLNRQNRMRMLRQVQAIWIDGLLMQSLHHAASLELHLQDRPDALANPWRLQVQELDQAPQVLPDGTTIVQVYDEAEGELLILGEPGAGKTTLLLELTRTLLERAEKDEQLPMPIVFNLSSWAEKRQSLRLWLLEELWTKYRVPRKIGQDWIAADQVLPLLDGLDEVAKEARSACVQQINEYYQSRLERGSSPIAVCCRSEEYAMLSTRVILQRAVSILPLTDQQINIYLKQAGEQVKALRQALNEDAELHSLVRQPLMLNIFTLAYQGATLAEVPTGETREEVQHIIFARYVERMLKRRTQLKRWKPEQVMRWLTFLAKQMQQHDQTVFSVESLQPTWLSMRRKIFYQWCVGSVSGLVAGLGFGLVGLGFGLLNWLIAGLAVGLFIVVLNWLIAGLAVGLVVALAVGPLAGRDTGINPAEVFIWSWEKARSGVIAGLVIGLVVALLAGPLAGLIVGPLAGLGFGLLIGLARRQLLERLSLSPNEGIWLSGKNGLFVGPLGGFLGCLIGWQLVRLVGGQFLALVSGQLIVSLQPHFRTEQ